MTMRLKTKWIEMLDDIEYQHNQRDNDDALDD